jgi:hypothetical protein
MRFVADGPPIPDELLLARDQGRVIFFCGAGVSRARAGLPDFFGLAENVVANLGVQQDSAVWKLIREAQEIDKRVGVSGVISADRVFGLLEWDFSSGDIEGAVASALQPPSNCDLSAHNILLDLATTPAGTVQLVTTNFDRLFDDCGRELQVWQPPRLPDPLRPNDINGIVYLHGRATENYSGAEGDGFVLSSSEFGRAYLSDGWATSFIREILGRYVVVFVGYTADDPPVQYLLEALRRTSGKLENAFAFQVGNHDDAVARWRHKGVEAIPYAAGNSHIALWQSLEAWAHRARNPDAWYAKIIETSKKGPSAHQPHERGQVAHVVSTFEGVKKFSEGTDPPPAEWLCVFDPLCRFAKPAHATSFRNKGPYIDPFERYGLDFDIPPNKLDPEDYYSKREVPRDAWDAFKINRLDRSSLQDDNLSALRGHWANRPARLVPRIGQLGVWIAKVCSHPSSVWWAAQQLSLHKDIQESISWELERSDRPIDLIIRQAWRALFEAWGHAGNDFDRDWYDLQAVIKKTGWSSATARNLGRALCPRLSAQNTFWGGPIPPTLHARLENLGGLVHMDVVYPRAHDQLVVPNEWCVTVVRVLRQNLELALTLEKEMGGYGLSNISPIVADNTHKSDNYHRTHGLSAAVILFSRLFSQLSSTDKLAAKREFNSWRTDDDTIFARLRIWAAGNSSIVSSNDFGQVIASLSDAAFWDGYHQRDLLLVLAGRWLKLSLVTRRTIEKRLLKGRKKWPGEKNKEFKERQTWLILSRVQWLVDAGCKFSSDLDEKIKVLRAGTPEWKTEYGAKAAESLEGGSGWVATNTSYEALLETPLATTLQRAKELSGRSGDFLVENDPFAGLVTHRPVRSLSALTLAAKQGNFAEWAWRRFLNSDARKNDNPRFARLIGRRLADYPDASLAKIIRPASDWLCAASANLSANSRAVFDRVLRKLVNVLKKYPSDARSGIVRGSREPDWTMEAINSPTGKIAEALFSDPRKNNLTVGQGFPTEWLLHAEALLALPDDLQRHALVILCHNLNWFYAIDPKWTEEHLLPVLDAGQGDSRDAAWSGFLWAAVTPNRELYLRLKGNLLAFATAPFSSRQSYIEIIAGMILIGWGSADDTTDERCISDGEMRSILLKADDHFRSRILWQVQRWAGEGNEGDSHEIWRSRLSDLLRIWPRQMSAKSPNISARLCELAFSSGDRFPKIAELVLPLLTRIERDHLMLPELRRSGDDVVDRHPMQALALLHAALPDNASAWPYGIEGILQRLGEADSTLNTDERLIDLRRRWDSR